MPLIHPYSWLDSKRNLVPEISKWMQVIKNTSINRWNSQKTKTFITLSMTIKVIHALIKPARSEGWHHSPQTQKTDPAYDVVGNKADP
jgi:hypothetical protein